MNISELSKRSFEILDLAHGGKAIADDDMAPPIVATWRVEQLEQALREAEQIAGDSKAAQRVASARREIEETVRELDRLRAEPVQTIDRIVRYGVPVSLVWLAVTSVIGVFHSAFLLLYVVPIALLALRFGDAGRAAIQRQRHLADLPFRLRLAWDKLANAERDLTIPKHVS